VLKAAPAAEIIVRLQHSTKKAAAVAIAKQQ